MTYTPGPWTLGEENVGGGYNIYAGPLRIAHTSIQCRVFKPETRAIGEEEAKANARLIVEAVNRFLFKDPPEPRPYESGGDYFGLKREVME